MSLVLSSFAGRQVSAEAASILSTIGGVLAGGIAAYLGNSSSPTNRDPGSRTRSGDTQASTPAVLDGSSDSGLVSGPDTQ